MTSPRKTTVFTLAILLIAAVSVVSQPWPLTLAWDNPTENIDGSPLRDLAGILMCLSDVDLSTSNPGMSEADCKTLARITDATGTGQFAITSWDGEANVQPKKAGLIYIRAAAFDTSGNLSAYSDQVTTPYDTLSPKQPNLKEVIIQFILKFTQPQP